MKLTTLKNVAAQALKPRRFAVMATKVWERIVERGRGASRQHNLEWITKNLADFSELADGLDRTLWAESQERAIAIAAQAQQALKRIPYDLGGGGIYPLLHFLVRYLKPQNIVETGVAAGFSSYAFLDALQLNGRGTLYSSDFPYFRLPNPERYIGILVPPHLHSNWKLYIEGDRANLPRILNDITGQINLFHYDSDKSYMGRKFTMDTIQRSLASDSVVIMDDIQDNDFFHDYVCANAGKKPYFIFKFEGKYVGMSGEFVRNFRK